MKYFYGEDSFAARQAINEIAASQPATIRWLDYEELTQRPFAEWIGQRQGLFGQELPVVRDVSKLPKGLQTAIIEQADKDTLVILWDRSQPDRRSALFKKLRPFAREFSHLPLPIIAAALVKECATRNIQLEAPAASALVNRLGPDGWRLRAELERLSLTTSHITVATVETVDVSNISADIFATVAAVAHGHAAQALRAVTQALAAGHTELYLLSMLAYEFRTLLLVQRALEAGHTAATIAQQTGLPPFVVQKHLQIRQRFTSTQMLDILTRILATDFAIKQGKVEARTGLLMLIIGVAPTPAT